MNLHPWPRDLIEIPRVPHPIQVVAAVEAIMDKGNHRPEIVVILDMVLITLTMS